MKIKNKVIALLEIAVVLCSVFIVAIPAIAAMQEVSASEVITASKDDYVLGVYGNANEDDTIDMRDLTYVKLIFFGKKPEMELADAKYDGKINPLDFIQIKLIIVGKEKEITLIDGCDRIVTINKPVERIIPLSVYAPEILRTLDATDKIVGVSEYIIKAPSEYFGEFCDLPSIGKGTPPDYEAILNLEPDLVIYYSGYGAYCKQGRYYDIGEKIESLGITVLRLDCNDMDNYVEDVRKLGYVVDKKHEAEEFIDWYKGVIDPIKDQTGELSEEDKPRVYSEFVYDISVSPDPIYMSHTRNTPEHKMLEMAGARNIAADLLGSYFVYVDPEWVAEKNPEIIVGVYYYTAMWGSYDMDDTAGILATREAILDRPELAKVPAVEDEKVYMLHWDLTYGGGHFVGVAYLAKWFHPSLFKDLDPQAIHQEFLTRFQRIDYDLDEHGVFVYPSV